MGQRHGMPQGDCSCCEEAASTCEATDELPGSPDGEVTVDVGSSFAESLCAAGCELCRLWDDTIYVAGFRTSTSSTCEYRFTDSNSDFSAACQFPGCTQSQLQVDAVFTYFSGDDHWELEATIHIFRTDSPSRDTAFVYLDDDIDITAGTWTLAFDSTFTNNGHLCDTSTRPADVEVAVVV